MKPEWRGLAGIQQPQQVQRRQARARPQRQARRLLPWQRRQLGRPECHCQWQLERFKMRQLVLTLRQQKAAHQQAWLRPAQQAVRQQCCRLRPQPLLQQPHKPRQLPWWRHQLVQQMHLQQQRQQQQQACLH